MKAGPFGIVKFQTRPFLKIIWRLMPHAPIQNACTKILYLDQPSLQNHRVSSLRMKLAAKLPPDFIKWTRSGFDKLESRKISCPSPSYFFFVSLAGKEKLKIRSWHYGFHMALLCFFRKSFLKLKNWFLMLWMIFYASCCFNDFWWFLMIFEIAVLVI